MSKLPDFDVAINPTTGCWEYQGYIHHDGYGAVQRNGVRAQAHRMAWMQLRGPIPDNMLLCHKCDNRKCVNPDHMFIGTNADNQKDKAEKSRACRGESRPLAKLTEKIVREMRASTEPTHILAKRYNIDKSTVKRARNGRTWKHVK